MNVNASKQRNLDQVDFFLFFYGITAQNILIEVFFPDKEQL